MSSEKKIIVSLGSNSNQIENIKFAKQKLEIILGENTLFTNEIWTEPIGMVSNKFLNCLCVAATKHTKSQLDKAFKHIEKQCQRSKKNDKQNKITLDIDILLFGDEKFHPQDWERGYVRKLMEDIENKNFDVVIDPTLKSNFL